MVLWTRLAPSPEDPGGGLPPVPVLVDWEIADDDRFSKVVQSGQTLARPELGHSVHVEVSGLSPGRWYHYRFRVGPELSAVGHTRTAPAASHKDPALRLAVTCCHNYQQGLYTGYQHMVADSPDLVMHLGDYIYESGVERSGPRRHNGGETVSLDDYRRRYALYRSDPLLQAAHAACPWVCTWDDHEVENNYCGPFSENQDDPALFLLRRAASYQAYYEHMPLRLLNAPAGADMMLYRRILWGDMATIHMLDTRQYRTGQPHNSGDKMRDEGDGPAVPTMMGPTQERWLNDGLAASRARFNLLGQGVFVAQKLIPGRALLDDGSFNLDSWDAYPAARRRFVRSVQNHRPANPVVFSGDVHSNWVCDLKTDFDDPRSATVGTEIVATSLSSGGNGVDVSSATGNILAANPHLRFQNAQRGYVICDLTPASVQFRFRTMPFVTRPLAPIATRATFVIEPGRPGAVRA